jgi:hypothetical protein
MSANDKNSWREDFIEFVQTNPAPTTASQTLQVRLRQRLFPNPWVVFAKVFGLHVIVGFLSLAVCHQFGLNPFQTDKSLADWFMTVGGHNFCMLACGVLFMALTYGFANLFLSLEEVEAVRKVEWLQTGITGLVSLAAFYFFGAQLVMAVAVLWAVGALVGGLVSIELSYRLRRSLVLK